MVPKIANGGASFGGAGSYYLGEGRNTDSGISYYMLEHGEDAVGGSRVGFAETRNLSTDDAAEAFQAMQATYDRYRELNAGRPGRKLTEPVYSYSLSWAPEERPDRATMIAAAEQTLKVLGMEDNQAVIVSHTDKTYRHVHVIVNRVNPDMKKAASTSMDRLKLSKWAEAYEREHGTIFCEQRVENNRRRAMGEIVKDEVSKSRQEIEAERYAEKRRQQHRGDERGGLTDAAGSLVSRDQFAALHAAYDDASQKMERRFYDELNVLFEAADKDIEKAQTDIRDEYRPRWRKHYDLERKAIKLIKESKNNIFERAVYVFNHRHRLGGDGGETLTLKDMVELIVNEEKLVNRVKHVFKAGRADIAREQKEERSQRIEDIRLDRDKKVNKIADRQALERAAFQKSKSDDLARYSEEQLYDNVPATSFLDRALDNVSNKPTDKEKAVEVERQSFLDRQAEEQVDKGLKKQNPSLGDDNDRGL